MQCRSCGTEIADKAIVCYRCGAATTDPVRKPVELRRRGSLMPAGVATAVLLLLALYFLSSSRELPDPSQYQGIAAALAGAAAIVLVLGIRRQRR